MAGRNRLAGKNCLIMREASQAKPLADGISTLGGHSFIVPLISFRKRELHPNELEVIKSIESYQWIIFTSQNGVRFFMEQLKEMGQAIPEFIKIAAVGTKTEKILNDYGFSVSLVPQKFTGDVLAEEMTDKITGNERMLIVKGNLARDAVGKAMQDMGLTVDTVIIYETFLPEESKQDLIETLSQNKIDILIFTSPSTVNNFVKITGEKLASFIKKKWVACIGPVTKKALEQYQLPVHICPDIYTIDQLLVDLREFQYN